MRAVSIANRNGLTLPLPTAASATCTIPRLTPTAFATKVANPALPVIVKKSLLLILSKSVIAFLLFRINESDASRTLQNFSVFVDASTRNFLLPINGVDLKPDEITYLTNCLNRNY